jgi:hypothetical protein
MEAGRSNSGRIFYQTTPSQSADGALSYGPYDPEFEFQQRQEIVLFSKTSTEASVLIQQPING